MSLTIIFGGQFGSEGKGKVANYFVKKEHAKYCVRVGGPNSGHTVYKDGNKLIFRILPTGAIEKNVTAILSAGSYIDLNILNQEISMSGLSKERLIIDENAVIMSNNYQDIEKEEGLIERIGSTGSGTGAALMARIKRDGKVVLARDCTELKPFVVDTKAFMREVCKRGEKIVAEGTQGFGLSLLHSKEYPYATARDTSAAAIVSELGLSPFDVENIVMVIRSFPIRVSGNSGPLKNEITWDILRNEVGNANDMTEYTSCTNRIRRVGRFDADVVRRSIISNSPNIIVLNHLDYCREPTASIDNIQKTLNVKINYCGYGPDSLTKV